MASSTAKSILRKAGRTMLIIISILLAAILILTGVLLAWSYPGKPKPILDSNGNPLQGSLSEKIFVEINGMQQGMIIQSKNIDNPVLLYLHGGMPDYFLTETYPTGLEEHFTVVWWEQRGSGLSYSSSLPRETLNLDQMISDTIAVTKYLQGRFGKEKVYLMGHSGGTFIGIQTAARAPELYYAYIGVAQMSNQLQSERRAYNYMLQEFQLNGNKDMARKLESAPVTVTGGTPPSYLLLRDVAMHSLGIGTTHDMNSVARDLFLASLRSPQYTLREKYDFWHGKASSVVSALWDEMLAT